MKRSPLKRKTALKRKPGELDRILMAYHGFKPLDSDKKKKALKRKTFKRKLVEDFKAAIDYVKNGKPLPEGWRVTNRKPGSLDAALEQAHGTAHYANFAVKAMHESGEFVRPMNRKKPLGPGKKTLARKSAMKAALDAYFVANGYQNEEGEWVSLDQVTGLILHKRDAVLHHKTPRSELRKAGAKDLDAPHRLIVTHWAIHVGWVHNGHQGRPYRTHEHDGEADAERRFEIIEHSPAHAGNNELVDWSPQDRQDMLRFIGIRGGI